MVTAEQLHSERTHGILIPREHEQEYARQVGLELRRLDNGIILVGMNRPVPDKAHASITYNFSTGASKDPEDKPGAHHFLEHFMIIMPAREGWKNRAIVNAHTDGTTFEFTVSGAANPDVKEYGVWPALPLIRAVIEEPLGYVENKDAVLESEKDVVRREKARDRTFEKEAERFYSEIVYDADDPNNANTAGSLENLASITLADLQSLAEEVVIPNGLTISVFTQGDQRFLREIMDLLEEAYNGYPRSNKKNMEAVAGGVNPAFTHGVRYARHIPIADGEIKAYLVWIIPTEKFSPQYYAAKQIGYFLHPYFFDHVRGNGLSYDPLAYSHPYDRSAIVNMEFQTATPVLNKALSNGFLSGIQENVIMQMSDEELTTACRLENLKLKASPIGIDEQFSALLEGLYNYDQLIDIEGVLQNMRSVTPEHYRELRDTLLSVDPAMILAGDLTEYEKPYTE